MFGVSLPSIADVKNAVSGTAATALHTTEDLGHAAISHAQSLSRSGVDLGRAAVSAVSHLDVQKIGATVNGAIGEAEGYAERGLQAGVTKAGQGVHVAANYARDHIPGDNPLSRAARSAITAGEDLTRFDIGVVGGVGKAGVGLVGSVGQLGVLATEYQVSPSARAAIDAKVGGVLVGGAKSAAGYLGSVAHDPSRVVGDAEHVASAGAGWVQGEVKSARQAIQDGHGPESFGMTVGNAATYLIPVGGEVRLGVEGAELAARGLAGAAAGDGVRALGSAGVRSLDAAATDTVARAASDVAKAPVAAATPAAAGAAGKTASDYGVAFFGESNLGFYTRDAATLGREGSSFFLMPLEDSTRVTDAASAARYTGMSPSTLEAYTKGGDIYGVSFPTEGMALRQPTAADAGGWPHFLEGGHTAVKTGDGPGAAFLVNPTRELVTPGGAALPAGSTLFKLGEHGAWTPLKRF